MSIGQLWLLPPPRPLVERLGGDFFRQLPDRPGVYLMCGPDDGVLYVGKAKSLRRRLNSYRVANPERLSRRIIRLLHQVTRIEWDECPTEAAARQREEMLIVSLSPKFNAAGKVWPLPDHAAIPPRRKFPIPQPPPPASVRSENIPTNAAPKLSPTNHPAALGIEPLTLTAIAP